MLSRCAILVALSVMSVVPQHVTAERVKCPDALAPYVASVDSRSDVSRERLQMALSRSIDFWNSVGGSQLFSGDGIPLPIHLKFGAVQQRYNENERLKAKAAEVKRQVATMNRAIAGYDREAILYEDQKGTYEEAVEAYNANVARWNRGERNFAGASSPKAFEFYLSEEKSYLASEKAALDELFSFLRERRAHLTTNRNALQRRLERLQADIAAFQQKAQKAGFEQAGVFSRRGNKRKIDLFLVEHQRQLTMLLAHELGHALGIGHVDDPKAVMYFRLSEENKNRAIPARADIDGFWKRTCP